MTHMSNVVSGQQHARHDGEQGQAVGSSARAGRPSARTAAHGEVEGLGEGERRWIGKDMKCRWKEAARGGGHAKATASRNVG